jgi:hypothetical protein
MRKRRETGNDCAKRGQRRRAARFHQSFPCTDLDGYFPEALRPPHPSPKAGHEAAFPSFLYFERDLRGPSGVSSTPVSSEEPRASARGFFYRKSHSTWGLSALKPPWPFIPAVPSGAAFWLFHVKNVGHSQDQEGAAKLATACARGFTFPHFMQSGPCMLKKPAV